ncbi:hypothetical protein CPC08DRAFT_716945, partial [Agrocybe pediades]
MCISVQVSGRHGAPASNNETLFIYDFVSTSAPHLFSTAATSTTSNDTIATVNGDECKHVILEVDVTQCKVSHVSSALWYPMACRVFAITG